jgi:hypothetical protein
MTRWIRTALTCTAVAFGLAFLAPVASAEEPPVPALPNSGTLTWHLNPIQIVDDSPCTIAAPHPDWCSD